MHQILFTGNTLSETEMQDLKSRGFFITPGKIDYSEDDLIVALQGKDGYILGGEEIATARVIEAASNLRIIGFYGAGYERYVDTKTASTRGIIVTNTPKANAHTVAEFTVGLVLDIVKRITYLNNNTKKGGWEKYQAWNLKGKTLGIVGMGAVGRNVARILHNGFEMSILYVSQSQKVDVEAELGASKVDLPELLRSSDIVSLHASYSDSTVGLLGLEELEMMKPTAVLVNTARAELVNASALYMALESNKISAAAFDCYYTEPVPSPENDQFKLLSLPDNRFIITPHTSYNSKEAVKQMEQMALNSVIAALEGKEPENIVNPDFKKHI